MAAAAIFWTVNFDGKSGCGTPFSVSVSNPVQICNNGQVMAKNMIFNMAAAAIVDFYSASA